MLLKNWKIRLTLTLNILLVSCGGTPPKMERPVKFYSGNPEKMAMCRNTKEQLAEYIVDAASKEITKQVAKGIVNAILAEDVQECILSSSDAFKTLAGVPWDDIGVMLRYQENLVFSCEKWKE